MGCVLLLSYEKVQEGEGRTLYQKSNGSLLHSLFVQWYNSFSTSHKLHATAGESGFVETHKIFSPFPITGK